MIKASRRTAAWAGFAVIALSVLVVLGAQTSRRSGDRFPYPKLGPPWPAHQHPDWLAKGVVFAGNWEPLQWIYRKNWQEWSNARAGTINEQMHKADRSEESVVALKKLGVNLVFTSFHKGFGIENEKGNMAEAAEYSKLLHKHGLKMAVYVSALLLYEDLFAEIPEAKDWHRLDHDGTPQSYFNDGYRIRAYLNHPGYMNYMKRVCELALKAGADAIFFDLVRQPSVENHNPMAVQMFRQYLKAKYPDPASWFFRTGLHHYDYVRIPHYSGPLPVEYFVEAHDQPLMQEYIHFKTQQVLDYAAEMGTFVRQRNPQAAIWFNSGGIRGENTAYIAAMDHARLLPLIDMYYTEEYDYARYTDEGALISKIRTIKAGSRFGTVHLNATAEPPPETERSLEPVKDDMRLRLAEAMAFNRLSLGNMGYGTTMVGRTFPEYGRRWLNFYWKNFDDLLAGCEPAADVAVLRTFASMAFNSIATHRETILAEQALIQAQVPFDILFDADMDKLARYKAVVLGNQESLTDQQVEALRAYVRNGGAIVATANTSIYNEWRRQRETFGLADVFGVELPSRTAKPVRKEFGSGRSVYIPKLAPSVVAPPRTAYTVKYWALPRNAAELIQSLQWAGGGKLTWKVTAPPFVAVEAWRQTARDRYVFHVLNYNFKKQPSVDGIKVDCGFPGAAGFTKLTAYSPDDDKPVTLRAQAAGDRMSFTLPRLGVYEIIVMEK